MSARSGLGGHVLREIHRQGNRLCTCDIAITEVYSGLLPQHRALGAAFLSSPVFLTASAAAAQQSGE